MARQYSHTQFFRQVPNALLGRYFQNKHNVLQEIVFDQFQNKMKSYGGMMIRCFLQHWSR
jgi:hypothetical protein